MVQEVSQAFDTYWNSAVAVPVLALVDAPKDPGSWHRYANNSTPKWQRPSRRRTGRPLTVRSLRPWRSGENLTWEQWTLVVDPPEKAQAGFEARRSEQLTAQLRPTADAAQTEFVLVSPYFVPRDRGSSGCEGCGNGACGSWL